MRALVVYESMYGNTRLIAARIADGLRHRFEATEVPAAEATPELVAAAGLLIVGAPTHMFRLPTAASRELAAAAAAKQGSGLVLDPRADGPGVREWLQVLGSGDGNRLAAAFDTRLDKFPVFTGRAGHGIARLLTKHDYRLVVEPQSFLVNSRNELIDGELARASQWGKTLGALVQLQHAAA